MSEPRHPRIRTVSEEARVTPIELFFDLVFVFSLTRVTALMALEPMSASGLARGLLVLALLWWSWVGYAWLGNLVRADEGLGRVAMFGAMAATFVLALAVPEAFDDVSGGLNGPVVFALAYLAVRLLHLAIFLLASGEDPALRRQVWRFSLSVAGSTALLLVASQLVGHEQSLMWAGVVAFDYVGTILAGASGWRLNSAAHFAERHGLIVIVALGESIVAIGVGVTGDPISAPVIVASVLGLTVAACVWWAYFDVVAIVTERILRRADGEERARLARDAYSYLHFPMIAGIILMALGLKKVLEYVGDRGHRLSDPLEVLPLCAMFGGVALYLLAHVGFRFRATHHISLQRTVAAVLLLALIPAATAIPALAALGLLAAVMIALITLETVRFSEVRERVRHEDSEPPQDVGGQR